MKKLALFTLLSLMAYNQTIDATIHGGFATAHGTNKSPRQIDQAIKEQDFLTAKIATLQKITIKTAVEIAIKKIAEALIMKNHDIDYPDNDYPYNNV